MSDLPEVTTLPATAMTDDLIDRIAKEVAAQVVAHVETMYPDAAKAVAWNSCKLSIQGVVRNSVASPAYVHGVLHSMLDTMAGSQVNTR